MKLDDNVLPTRSAERERKVAGRKQRGKKEANRSRKKKRVPKGTQGLIDYYALVESGVMSHGDGTYTMLMRLSDVTYMAAAEATQRALLENYAEFLNSFDAGVGIQILVATQQLNKDALLRDSMAAPRGDGLDGLRREQNETIAHALSVGRNNTVTSKYVLVTVEAPDIEAAQVMLANVETSTAAAMRSIGGCIAERVSGEGWVRLLQSILRPGGSGTFRYTDLLASKLSTKDFVAPWSINRGNAERLVLSGSKDTYFQGLVLRDLPPWLSDSVVRELTEISAELSVSMHFRPIPRDSAVKMVKSHIAALNMERQDRIKKLHKQNLPEDMLPHELQVSHAQAEELLQELETSNQKMFDACIVVGVYADSSEELQRLVQQVQKAAMTRSCTLEVLKYMQVDALNAVLPVGRCSLPIWRSLTTAGAAVLVPFTSEEILQPGGLFYGANTTSQNLILGSRSSLMNGNAFFLGTSGSGKSFTGKWEMGQVALRYPNDQILIIDPEMEYRLLGERLGATRIVVSPDTNDALNPLELVDDGERGAVKQKCLFVLNLMETLIGGTEGLTPQQRSLIDRIMKGIYTRRKPGGEQPTLVTLHAELLAAGQEGAELANMLELYATGSFNGFAKQTNVDLSNRITIFDTSEIGDELQTFGMMIVLEQIWSQVVRNRAAGVRTWIYVDEFHMFFDNDFAAKFFQRIWKRVRKYGAFATGLTQNIEELLANEKARLMLANSAMLVLLNQVETDADALQDLLGFSDEQRKLFRNQPPGKGLLKMGSASVGFDLRINENTELFRLYNTKFQAA